MIAQLLHTFAAACSNATFFGIPPWYKYLIDAGRMKTVTEPVSGLVSCQLDGGFRWADGDIVLIMLGILDMALRLAGIVAVAFIIYGGIMYIVSDGQPDKTKNAQQTIINALIGLILALIATATVSFIGNRIG